jgi:hypothetical protein
MIDPLTVALLGTGVHGVVRLCTLRAEARVVQARVELVRAAAELPPGAELNGVGLGGRWLVRIQPGPAAVAALAGAGE